MASSADKPEPATSSYSWRTRPDASLSLAMVAGETSGDLLASRLLSGLRPLLPNARMYGIGGEHMGQWGFQSQVPLEKLAVRGLFEVLAHYREIKGIRDRLRSQLLAEKPQVFVGIDAPDFNLDLETQLRAGGIPTVHFISPSIWAWRGARIKKIAQAVSHMLVIFPFEEEIYAKAGIPATYVGHPLAEVIPMEPDVPAARARLGLSVDDKVLAILPGSRMSELRYNAVPFMQAAALLLQREPRLKLVAPMAGESQTRYFTDLLHKAGLADVPVQIVPGQSHDAMAAADAVLVASGTATLEVALFKKPMVIAYKMMEASWQVLRHMGYQPWIGLPNIMAREFVVPELLQRQANPQAIAEALWKQLDDDNLRGRLADRFTMMHHDLLRNTAALSAEAVLNVMAAHRRGSAT